MFQKEGDLVRKTWRKNRVPRRGEGGGGRLFMIHPYKETIMSVFNKSSKFFISSLYNMVIFVKSAIPDLL